MPISIWSRRIIRYGYEKSKKRWEFHKAHCDICKPSGLLCICKVGEELHAVYLAKKEEWENINK